MIDFVWRTRENNGIKGYVQKMDIEPNSKNIISISQIWTIVAQIRTDEWYASQNIFSLKPKNKNLISLLILSSINKVLWWTFSDWYSNYPTLKKLEKLKISLPIKKNTNVGNDCNRSLQIENIDFDFIEKFIAELNAKHLAELNAYLLSTWLKDYKLTPREEEALNEFDDRCFEENKIIDIFDVKNSGNILARDIVPNSWNIPYLCASKDNNAVSSYISYDEKYLDKWDCIFIWWKTFVVSYQEKDFYSNDSHNLILYLKEKARKTKLNQLFLATCINKSLEHKYSWWNSISNKKIQKDYFSLPTKNWKLDFEFMETLISAVQKLVIKDVVNYAEREEKAMREIIWRE